jgi:two-component system invasion response regulator UvrY
LKTDIKVLLIDDHAILREGYKHLLESAGFIVCGQASSADEGYHCFSQLQPDISIVDMTMPGAGGIECIRRIRSRDNKALVLVCSMHENPTIAIRAMDVGASGYISKSCSSSILIEAIKTVLSGQAFFSNDIAKAIAMKKVAQSDESISSLSNQEFAIFRLVSEGKTITEIADDLMLSPKTVSNYKTNMMRKLGTTKLNEIILLAQEMGLSEQAY